MSLKHVMLAGVMTAAAVFSQVPPDLAKEIALIGRGVCVAESAQIYRPLHTDLAPKGVTITRDVSFGPDPKNVVDLFEPESGKSSLPVLIYVPGGAGNKRQAGSNGEPFYDNILLWAAKNGMVGVNMQRRPGNAWDDPAKDVSVVVQWVNRNIASHKGNPNRVFLWSQSAGNVPVSTYIAHPEFYGPNGVGVKGVVFMSAPAFNILPAKPPETGPISACGKPTIGTPAPPAAAGAGPGRGNAAPPVPEVDAATLLARSNLPGLVKSKLPFIVSCAEFDPPSIVAFAETLRDELTKGGHKPTFLVFKDHGHISEVMSPNTADNSVTGPILRWMKGVK